MRRALPDLLWTLLLAVAVALAPTVLRALFAQASVSYLSIASNAISLAILALSWDLLARTGQLSLAHAACSVSSRPRSSRSAASAPSARSAASMPMAASRPMI